MKSNNSLKRLIDSSSPVIELENILAASLRILSDFKLLKSSVDNALSDSITPDKPATGAGLLTGGVRRADSLSEISMLWHTSQLDYLLSKRLLGNQPTRLKRKLNILLFFN